MASALLALEWLKKIRDTGESPARILAVGAERAGDKLYCPGRAQGRKMRASHSKCRRATRPDRVTSTHRGSLLADPHYPRFRTFRERRSEHTPRITPVAVGLRHDSDDCLVDDP